MAFDPSTWAWPVVPPDGDPQARVAFFGEAPGKHESHQGIGFCGPSGDILWQYVRRILGLEREQVWVSNVCKVRPGPDNEDPTEEMLECFRPGVETELAVLRDLEVVVAVGRIACHELGFPREIDMRTMNAVARLIVRPNVLPYVLVGVTHPAAGIRDADQLNYTWAGLQKVAAALKRPPAPVLPPDDHRRWPAHREYLPVGEIEIAVDTEGNKANPYCLTWATSEWCGIIKAKDAARYAEYLRGRRVWLHNALWDLKVLKAMGIDLEALGCDIEDGMLLSYQRKLQPNGLKELAYRELGIVREDYKTVVQPAYDEQIREWARGLFPAETFLVDKWKGRGKAKVLTKETKVTPLGRSLRNLFERETKDTVEKRARALAAKHPQLEVPRVDYDKVPGFEEYAVQDAIDTANLAPILWIPPTDQRHETYRIDMGMLPMLNRMEEVGLPVDLDRMHELQGRFAGEMDALQEVARGLTGLTDFNLGSGDMVAAELVKLGIDTGKMTPTGRRMSVDNDLLMPYQGVPLVDLELEYKELEKLKGTYCDGVIEFTNPVTRRLHPKFKVTEVKTGRLSAEDPNVLAFPVRTERGKLIRNAFKTDLAGKGRVMSSWDLSQIELRVLADEARDEAMIADFVAGLDKHQATADRMKVKRGVAKTLNFGIVYGSGPGKVMEVAGCSWDQAEQLIALWFALHPGVKVYMGNRYAEARRYGYVTGRYGRRMYVAATWLQGNEWPQKYLRMRGERQAGNGPIQNGAQDMLKVVMGRVWRDVLPKYRRRGKYCEPLLQIHDELMIEHDGDITAELDQDMRAAMVSEQDKFCVPLETSSSTSDNWGGLKD